MARQERRHQIGRHVVGANSAQRSAVLPDRGPQGVDDHGSAHRSSSSRGWRIVPRRRALATAGFLQRTEGSGWRFSCPARTPSGAGSMVTHPFAIAFMRAAVRVGAGAVNARAHEASGSQRRPRRTVDGGSGRRRHSRAMAIRHTPGRRNRGSATCGASQRSGQRAACAEGHVNAERPPMTTPPPRTGSGVLSARLSAELSGASRGTRGRTAGWRPARRSSGRPGVRRARRAASGGRCRGPASPARWSDRR